MGAASIRLPQRLSVKLREKAEETDSLPEELGVELLSKGLKISEKIISAILATVIVISVFTVAATTGDYSNPGTFSPPWRTIQHAIIINHTCTNLPQIPEAWVTAAKDNLHIAYGHTSHGSQIITGMDGLDAFMGGTGLYTWNDGPAANHLDIGEHTNNNLPEQYHFPMIFKTQINAD